MGRGPASGTPALSALVGAGVQHTVHRYRHDPRTGSYGREAVAELGVDPARVLKTLVAAVDGRLVVAVLPVEERLDLRALARVLGDSRGGSRGALADASAAQRATGYVTGGISPIGQRRRLATVVDSSALDHATVLISAGRRGLEVELAPQALVEITGACVAPLVR